MADLAEENAAARDTQRRPINLLPFGIGGAILLLLFAVGSAIGGELGQFMGASLNAMPFAVLAILAYLGRGQPNWAWIAVTVWVLMMVGAAALAAFGLSVAALADGPIGENSAAALESLDWMRVGLVTLCVFASVVVGALTLLPPVRRLLARFVPIDPHSFIHTVALVTVVTISLICFVPLLIIGVPPFLVMVEQLSAAAGGRGQTGQLLDLLYGLVWTVPATVLAVGYGISRSLPEALQRLGLVRPSLRQVGAAAAIALLLVGAVQLIGIGIDWLWGIFGWPVSDDAAFEKLIAFAINPLGALVIGVTAGLGEELAVRGVLQPRLGLLLSNVFFTSLHAFQYSWDALLIVFFVGMICGVVRMRTNTSTAAIVHGVYNFTLIMLAVWGIGG